MLGSVGYLLDSFGKLLVTGGGAVAALVPACMVVSTVAELAMVGWLLVFGIKGPRSERGDHRTRRLNLSSLLLCA